MNRPSRLISFLALAALTLGCGGDGEPTGAADTTADPAPGAADTARADTAASPADTAAAAETSGDTRAPAVFRDRYPLTAPYPEGGTYDPATHTFYVGSLGAGTVHAVDAATAAERTLFTPDEPGTWWTLGMAIDDPRRLLWVCAMDDQRETSDVTPPYEGFVWLLDPATGARTARHALGDAFATATCTDVAVTADGSAYVVDREHPNVYRVDPESGATLFASDPALDGTLAGMNGAVVLPDQSALMVVVYMEPALVRIDLADASVRKVSIDGEFLDDSFLGGADGLAWHDDSLVIAFSSTLTRVRPTDATWAAGAATSIDLEEGLTDVIAAPGGLYLLNGQAVVFALGREPAPFALWRFEGSL